MASAVGVRTEPRGSRAPGQPRPPAAELVGVGKQFGDDWVIREVSFRVERGAIFGLFGPSGSGKTTTIRLLLGLLRPDEGELRVLGVNPARFRAADRSRIGYLPQQFVLYPELSVNENINLAAALYGLGWIRRRRAIRQALELVQLWDDRGKVTARLSGGMRRRLALACALVHAPELLVVDEPTAGIDPVLRARLWEHLHQLRDEGHAIFVTSQYVSEAEYCDRIAVLGQGQVVAAGTPAEVREAAFGGEIVDLVADGLTRAVVADVAGLPEARGVNWISYEELRVTVEHAGPAIPIILEALRRHGVEAREIQEYRPSFDEVFVRLVGRPSSDNGS